MDLFTDAALTQRAYRITIPSPVFEQAYRFSGPAPDTGGIVPGTYYVRASIDGGSRPSGLHGGATPTPVTVTEGQTRIAINVTLTEGTDLAITKTAPETANVNEPLTYTITVMNQSATPATGVTVIDPLPASVDFQSATATPGQCTGVTTIRCELGLLDSEQSATITIVVRPTAGGTLTNTATVSAVESDPDPSDNTATATTTITAGITVNATALSTPTFTVRAVAAGALIVAGPFPTSAPQFVSVGPGAYAFDTGGNSTPFNVGPDGKIAFAATLDAFVSGRGTGTLTVTGFPISIDARAATGPSYTLSGATPEMIATPPVSTIRLFRLVPGGYRFVGPVEVFDFSLTGAGTVDFAAAFNAFVAGRGTTTLSVGAAGITFSARESRLVVRPLTGTRPEQPAGGVLLRERRAASLPTGTVVRLTLPAGVQFTSVPLFQSSGLVLTGARLEAGGSTAAVDVGSTSVTPASIDVSNIRYTVGAAALAPVVVAALAGPFSATASNAQVVADSATPSVGSITPAALGQGAVDRELVIAGANFDTAAVVQFGTGLGAAFAQDTLIGVLSTRWDSTLQITVRVSVNGQAVVGPRTVRVVNPGGMGEAAVFEVRQAPVITTVATHHGDDQFALDVAGQTFTITGVGFQGGIVADFGPGTTLITSGLSADGNSGVLLTGQVSVAADPTNTFGTIRTLTVTNLDGGRSQITYGVRPAEPGEGEGLGSPASQKSQTTTAPSVTGLTPSAGLIGSTVSIAGARFAAGAGNSVTFAGSNNTRISAQITGTPTSTALTVLVPASAIDGPVTVAVNGVVSNGVTYTVTNPNLSVVLPSSGIRGNGSVTVALTGSKFANNATVAFTPSTGVTLGPVVFQDASHLTVPVTIGPSASLGVYDVTVTNPSTGGSSTKAGAFEVKDQPSAAIEVSLPSFPDPTRPTTYLPSVASVTMSVGATGLCVASSKVVTPAGVPLQARFVGPQGSTPPAQVTFTLTSSRLPGTATNEDCEVDPNNPTFDFSVGSPASTSQSFTVLGTNGIYATTLYSHDWGGNVQVSVSASWESVTISGTLALPVDTDDDKLPDAYESNATLNRNAAGVNVLNSQNRDQDGNGVVDGDDRFARDGLSNFRKYRGIYSSGPVNGTSGAMLGHMRLGAGMRHFFVRGRGFGTDPAVIASPGKCGINPNDVALPLITDTSGTPCPPFSVGTAFAARGVEVHDMSASFATGSTFPRRSFTGNTVFLDMATVVYDAVTCSEVNVDCGTVRQVDIRQWDFYTLGFSDFGSSTTYGATIRVLKRSVDGYFRGKPYRARGPLVGPNGQPWLAPITSDDIGDKNDNGIVDTDEIDSGDIMVPGSFVQALSAMDVNNDGCVELPLVGNPNDLAACDPLAASGTGPQTTKMQAVRHLITHELGHAAGVTLHTADPNDLMYEWTINWTRDGFLSDAAAALIQIHNGGVQ